MACETGPSGSLFPVGSISQATCRTCGQPLRFAKSGLWVHRAAAPARWTASDHTVFRFGERENQFCRICRWVDGKGLTRVVNEADRRTMGDRAYRAHRRAAFARHANLVHPKGAHTASNPRSS